MTDKQPNPEAEVAKAMAGLRKSLELKNKELQAARAALARQKSELAFAAAFDAADAFEKAKPLGLRLFMREVSDVKLSPSGEVVGTLGDLTDATPETLVQAFVEQNADFLAPIAEAEVGSTTPAPEPRRKVEPGTPTLADGSPVPIEDWTADECFAAAGPTPLAGYSGGGDRLDERGNLRLPEPKGTPFKPDSSSTRMAAARATMRKTDDDLANMSAEELLDGAGPPPKAS